MIERLKCNCVILICLFILSGCMSRYGAVTITTVPSGAEIVDAETEEVTVAVSVSVDDNALLPTQYFSGQSITRELTLRREGLTASN